MLARHDLSDGWTWRVDHDGPTPAPPEAVALGDARIAARVPGALHRDLEDAGIIPDPLRNENEPLVAWASRTDWVLERGLAIGDDAERVDLVFDGLDTVAEVVLDGVTLGRSRNMHRSYRYPIDTARAGSPLAVRFTSSYTEAELRQRELGARPNAYPQPFNFIRTMACAFGWDWGPTIVSAGLWRDVRIESWSVARIASVRPLADADGRLSTRVEVERAPSGRERRLSVEVTVAGVSARAHLEPGAEDVVVDLVVADVERWHPRGRGEPRLHDATVTLRVDDDSLDERTVRVGFRSVEIDRRADEIGSAFVLVVNGERMFAKGVNWIPDSIHPGTLTREDYRLRLTQAVDAGVNLIRVWGGGLYESYDFYDVCDELGLLVWQDFLFACASYPEDEPLFSEVVAEARENIVRLSAHPSLALWCGNNENLWMHRDKDWPAQPGGDLPWGERYYLEVLPRLVAELDPSRPYTEGSPWSGPGIADPNDVDHGTFHSWDVWNEQDYLHYRDSAPRFVSEFGWQGAATWRTLRDAIDDATLEIEAPAVRHHQKAIDGHAKMARALATRFPPTTSFDVWHARTQWTQVDALRTGILHWRSHWPRTAGTIVWQLNDLWPVVSWSLVDSAGRLKPSYFALRDVYADRVLTLEPVDGGLELRAINDTAHPWDDVARLRRIRSDGSTIAEVSLPVTARPRSVVRLVAPSQIAGVEDAAAETLVAELGTARAFWHPAEARDARPAAPPTVSAVATAIGLDILVTAHGVTRDVLVQPDRLHPAATVDRGFTTLLPGETAVFRVDAGEPLEPGAVERPFVVTWLAAIAADRL